MRAKRPGALETFKILNGLAPPVLSNLVKKQDHKYNFRGLALYAEYFTSSHKMPTRRKKNINIWL
jgi:hypothetical protein